MLFAAGGGDVGTTATVIALIAGNILQGGTITVLLLKKGGLAVYREVEQANARAAAAETKLAEREKVWEERFLPLLTQMPAAVTAAAGAVERLSDEQRELLVQVRILMGRA